MPIRTLLAGSLLIAASACEPAPPTAAQPSNSQQATGAVSTQALPPGHPPMGGPKPTQAGVTWTAPSAFASVQHPSPMRLATYKFAKVEGDADDAEMTVTRVGGDVQANINRWKSQFDPPAEADQSERTVGDLKVTVVSMSGTYQGMAMPGAPAAGPKPGYTMLAAIVVWPGHGDPTFFKLTGPSKTVDAARPAFDQLVASLAHP